MDSIRQYINNIDAETIPSLKAEKQFENTNLLDDNCTRQTEEALMTFRDVTVPAAARSTASMIEAELRVATDTRHSQPFLFQK